MQDYAYRWMVTVELKDTVHKLQINGDYLTVDETGLRAYARKDQLLLVFIPLNHVVNVQIMNIDGYANGFEILRSVK
jgi:hypothetical protein